MKTFVRKIFAGSAIRLAVLSVLFLGMAGACMAQASAAPAQPAAQAAVAPQAHPAAQPAQKRVPGEPAAKGTHEGIKVHGHWTIEVKNPDGKLVTHREFENSLTTQPEVSGATLLAGLLGRSLTAGSWQVQLIYFDSSTGAVTGGMVITEPNSATEGCTPSTTPVIVSCSNSLSISGPTTPTSGVPTGNTLTLMGTATVPQGIAAITQVATYSNSCFIAESPQTCFNDTQHFTYFKFTTRNLDGQNGDPAAVQVSAGQSVSVTVVISFQ
jgi:hypothetical protein